MTLISLKLFKKLGKLIPASFLVGTWVEVPEDSPLFVCAVTTTPKERKTAATNKYCFAVDSKVDGFLTHIRTDERRKIENGTRSWTFYVNSLRPFLMISFPLSKSLMKKKTICIGVYCVVISLNSFLIHIRDLNTTALYYSGVL